MANPVPLRDDDANSLSAHNVGGALLRNGQLTVLFQKRAIIVDSQPPLTAFTEDLDRLAAVSTAQEALKVYAEQYLSRPKYDANWGIASFITLIESLSTVTDADIELASSLQDASNTDTNSLLSVFIPQLSQMIGDLLGCWSEFLGDLKGRNDAAQKMLNSMDAAVDSVLALLNKDINEVASEIKSNRQAMEVDLQNIVIDVDNIEDLVKGIVNTTLNKYVAPTQHYQKHSSSSTNKITLNSQGLSFELTDLKLDKELSDIHDYGSDYDNRLQGMNRLYSKLFEFDGLVGVITSIHEQCSLLVQTSNKYTNDCIALSEQIAAIEKAYSNASTDLSSGNLSEEALSKMKDSITSGKSSWIELGSNLTLIETALISM